MSKKQRALLIIKPKLILKPFLKPTLHALQSAVPIYRLKGKYLAVREVLRLLWKD